jgi:hypothetical protein
MRISAARLPFAHLTQLDAHSDREQGAIWGTAIRNQSVRNCRSAESR